MRYARGTMSEQAQVVTLPTPSEPQERPEAERLARVLGEIREDARVRAPRYLDDSVVPEGGE